MKPGQLLMLSTEVYSDYGFSGPYRVLKEFTFRDVIAQVLALPGPYTDSWKDKAGPGDVTVFLKANGYIEEIIDCTEVHLGSYGDIDVEESKLDI